MHKFYNQIRIITSNNPDTFFTGFLQIPISTYLHFLPLLITFYLFLHPSSCLQTHRLRSSACYGQKHWTLDVLVHLGSVTAPLCWSGPEAKDEDVTRSSPLKLWSVEMSPRSVQHDSLKNLIFVVWGGTLCTPSNTCHAVGIAQDQ